MPPEEDPATATDNVHKNLKFDRMVSEICEWTEEQTKRHARRNTPNPTWGEVTTNVRRSNAQIGR